MKRPRYHHRGQTEIVDISDIPSNVALAKDNQQNRSCSLLCRWAMDDVGWADGGRLGVWAELSSLAYVVHSFGWLVFFFYVPPYL